MNAGPAPDRLARLREWAQGGNPAQTNDDGGCPWCGNLDPEGNAHDLAIELLDEIERLQADTKHCPPACASHGEHYWVAEILIGPLPPDAGRVNEGPIGKLFEDVADLAMSRQPLGCDVSMSAGVTSADAIGLVESEAVASETIHQCPPSGSTTMPCCGRTPFEVPSTDRMCTDPEQVTCAKPTVFVTSGDMSVELPVSPDKVVDLMAALEQSVTAAKDARARRTQPTERREEL